MHILLVPLGLSVWFLYDAVALSRAKDRRMSSVFSVVFFVLFWAGLLSWNLGDVGRQAFMESFVGRALLPPDREPLTEPPRLEGETRDSPALVAWRWKREFGHVVGRLATIVLGLLSGAFLAYLLLRSSSHLSTRSRTTRVIDKT